MSLITFTTYSIAEYISRNIATTLNNITIDNGYNFNMTFEREKKTNKPQHMVGVIFQEQPTETPTQEYSKQFFSQPYEIEIPLMLSEGDDTPIDTYVNLMFADVTKALMVDPTRGSYAFDTYVRGFYKAEALDGSGLTISISIDIEYRTDRNNPYTT